ncbi:uncharacterized protein LOC130500062 [Raphanus sativus]|uniref:Uncharacterized protein LOC130500062 n=1 Tax=Raphanus sativus TaxID=3726 RepID=A0A9W3CGL5_RAPSA|nr:uncharacterized protein LOC130500062 [Raphanus sativus]
MIEQSFRLGFNASNNEAEYESLIAGLRLAQSIGAQKISAFSDSQLVTSQFHGEYEQFDEFELTRIPRGENTSADALAALASTSNPTIRRVIPVEGINRPSIDIPRRRITDNEDDLPLVAPIVTRSRSKVHTQEPGEESLETPRSQRAPGESSRKIQSSSVRTVPARLIPKEIPVHEVNNESQKAFQDELESRPNWRTPIFNYIDTGELPPERWEAQKVKARSSRYCIMEGKLFKRTFSEPYLLCASPKEASTILKRTHDGSCGNHSGGRSLAIKIKKHGYFWPTIITHREQFAARCDKWQWHAPMLHQPTRKLSTIYSPYPFMKWSMDIVGPFVSSGLAQLRFLLVMTDFLTKWTEAEAYQNITGTTVASFIWKNIVCRHDFCDKWKIKLKFASPRYPKCNGHAEAANKTIVNNLKKRLDLKKSKWSEELNGVLWAYRTTPHTATHETPFSLTYGIEAVKPPEIEVPSQRRGICPDNVEINEAMLLEHLDMIEERRERAVVRIQNYQQTAACYYDSNVRGRSFSIGDLVQRKVFDGTKLRGAGKLGTRWECSYKITKEVRDSVYEL